MGGSSHVRAPKRKEGTVIKTGGAGNRGQNYGAPPVVGNPVNRAVSILGIHKGNPK